MLEEERTPMEIKEAGIYLEVPEQVWGLGARLMEVVCLKLILHPLVEVYSQGPTPLLGSRAT
jgi:hypothetical protein